MTRSLLRALTVLSLVTALSGCGFAADRLIAELDGTETFRMSSEGMEPTIKAGHVVTAKLVDGDYVPRTGDIVVFNASDWGVDGMVLMRVIGVPGSTVQCCDGEGRQLLDGRPMDEPYVHPGGRPYPFDLVRIPAGRIWVEGDHRMVSRDSRVRHWELGNGTVAVSNVVAVVELDG
ncbi:signal peptidase I [Planomonospora corallina]|uniref:Signal peptidase I n=1 Tax=Planomonospora corallina TaxID=1806052 RepID=A0ABV8HZK8_9ACTN